MRRVILAGLATLLLTGGAEGQRSQYFSNAKKITAEGVNSRASWSPDGTKLVFQSTRGGRECDQVYVMNADGTGVKMVSTGKGAASHGSFMPDGERIVYASTHGAGEECPVLLEQTRGYLWPIPPGYDLYVADLDGGEPERLTNAEGYDAEASVNWATGRIIYTSASSGDLEVWSMDMAGNNQSKLTSGIGYDGGGVLSADGRRILWQGHHPLGPEGMSEFRALLARNLADPMKMEIYIGDQYGMAAKKLTNFGCASLSPRFTPDGRQIIFASNMNRCDSRELELFLMGTDGYNLEQVARLYSFTAFPAFSPDGGKIVFTSSFGEGSSEELHLFVADWTGE